MAVSRHARSYPSIAPEAGRLKPFGDGYPSGWLTGRLIAQPTTKATRSRRGLQRL